MSEPDPTTTNTAVMEPPNTATILTTTTMIASSIRYSKTAELLSQISALTANSTSTDLSFNTMPWSNPQPRRWTNDIPWNTINWMFFGINLGLVLIVCGAAFFKIRYRSAAEQLQWFDMTRFTIDEPEKEDPEERAARMARREERRRRRMIRKGKGRATGSGSEKVEMKDMRVQSRGRVLDRQSSLNRR